VEEYRCHLRSRYRRSGALPLPNRTRPLHVSCSQNRSRMMVTGRRLAIADAMTKKPGQADAGDAEQPCDDHLGGAATSATVTL